MALEYINLAEDFYRNISESNNTIAQSTMWIVFFELPKILLGGKGVGGYAAANQKLPITFVENSQPTWNGNSWELFNIHDMATRDKWMRQHGCMYASQVIVPGENYGTERQGTFVTGYQRGLVGKGRQDFPHVQIQFLETNASFTDGVLRPWAILVGHNSLKISSVKTTLHVVPLQKMLTSEVGGNKARKVFSYFNCWPQFIGTETYDQNPDKLMTRTVNFAFDWYSVMQGDNKEELDVSDLEVAQEFEETEI